MPMKVCFGVPFRATSPENDNFQDKDYKLDMDYRY